MNSPKHIAFDERERKLYWTEPGRIRNANPNGTNRTRLVKEDLGELGGIAVADGRVYWGETVNGQGKVRSANSSGSGVKLHALLGSVPEGIAVDTVGGRLYWTTSAGKSRVRRSPELSELSLGV